MPTIKQLPAATAVGGSDLLPVSQNGLTRSVTVSTLLSNTQPLLSLAQGTLLGRASAGSGGPEAINVGTGVSMLSGTVVATGADHVSFTLATSLLAGDEVVLNSGAAPKRLAAAQLRSLFSAGSGIQIDGSGVISSTVSSGSGGTGSTTGPVGPQGPSGSPGVAGQGFTFRGAWQANTVYNPYDVVTNGGQTFVAAATVLAAATFAAASWSLVAAQGSNGVPGASGTVGATGPAGPSQAATSSAIGAVKPGTGLTVAVDGTLSITNVSVGSLGQGSAAIGQLLGWSGTGWTPTTPAAGVSYTGLSPITVASGAISLGQSGAMAGQVLTWSGTGWGPATPAVSASYNGSASITVASGTISLGQNGAMSGQVLTWTGTGWTPTTLAATNYTGSAPITVASGTVSLGQNGAVAGQVLTWSGTAWAPTTPPVTPSYTGSAPISVASGAISLSQNGAAAGQVLTWSGTAWAPTTPAAVTSYTGSSPITVVSGAISLSQSGAMAGQVLTWSGTAWAPTTPAAATNYTGSASITVASGTISISQNGAAGGQVLTWSGTGWAPQQPAASGASVGTAIPLAAGTASAGVAANASREDHRHAQDATRAPVASPVFTGSITLPNWTTTSRPTSTALGMEGFATDSGRRETFTSAGWVQYVRLNDLPAAGGQLLGGAGSSGAVAAVTVGSGLSLAGGTLSLAPAAPPTISGVSIDGGSIIASASTPYQMATVDRVIDVNKSSGAATKVLLPTNPTLWVEYTVIDGKGDAATNNITISGASGTLINGQSTFVMNANNDAIAVRAVSATVWRVA